jgi:hypothetical protein
VYQHPAYGAITIREDDGQLFMHLRDVVLPLQHYHYERFDSPNDVENGRWVLNFITNALGIVNRFVTAIGENEVVFLRQPPTHSTDLLARLAGTYETATGYRFEVRLRQDETLWLVPPGQTETRFIAHRGMEFRNPSAPGSIFEFIEEHGEIKSMKQTTPRAVHLSRKL